MDYLTLCVGGGGKSGRVVACLTNVTFCVLGSSRKWARR